MSCEEPQKLFKITYRASIPPPPLTENTLLRRGLCVMMMMSWDARWTRTMLLLTLLGVISSYSVTGLTADRNVTSSCPKACSCSSDVVNCSGASLDRVPVIPDSSAKTWILDDNNISYVGGDSFGSSDRPNIEQLSIRNNRLSSVDSDAFRRLPRLRNLYLDRNRISSIHSDVFENVSHLETLSVAHTSIGVMELDWAFLRPLVGLKKLDVSGTVIAYLHRVPLSFSGLVALEELTMQRMAGLNMTKAFFETVESLEIRTVDLSMCSVENVDEDAFLPLRHLRNLVLESVMVSSRFCQNMFYGLANGSLERINMQGVFIYDDYPVEADLFHHLRHSKVRELNFAGNYVGLRGRIPNKLFHPLKSLRKLHLDDCDIMSIREETFHGLHDLKVLTLRRNLLSCVRESDCGFLSPPSTSHQSRHPMRHLETIDLSDNLISEMENRFQLNASFPALASLNLRRNRLRWIPVGMFGDLKKLVRLDLSENPVEGIEPEALSSLESLTHLELDGCRHLTRIRQDVLAGLNQLVFLSVRNGRLAHVHRGAFANFSQLEELRLRGNRLGQDHDAVAKIFIQKSKLKVLDLGENDLESFPRGLLSNSFHLRRLHLDSNRLSDCRSLVQSPPEVLAQLEVLDLSYNSLVDPSPSCFESLRNLKTLDVTANPFYCSCRTQDLATWIQQNRHLATPAGTTECLCAAPGSLAGSSIFSLRLSSFDCYWKYGVTNGVLVCLLVASVVVVVWLCFRQTRRSSRSSPSSSSSVCAAGGSSPCPSAAASGAAEAVAPGCSIFSKSSSSAPYTPLDEEELTVRGGRGRGRGGSDHLQQADGFGRHGSAVIPSASIRGGGGEGDGAAAAERQATANRKSAKQNGFSRAKTRSLQQQQQQQQQRSVASGEDEASMQTRALVENSSAAKCNGVDYDDDDDDDLCHASPCFVTADANDADHVEDTV